MIARLFKWTLTSRIKDPAASNGVSNLQRCRAAGYLTLAAVAKCLQAATWLVARGNKGFVREGSTQFDGIGDLCGGDFFCGKVQKRADQAL